MSASLNLRPPPGRAKKRHDVEATESKVQNRATEEEAREKKERRAKEAKQIAKMECKTWEIRELLDPQDPDPNARLQWFYSSTLDDDWAPVTDPSSRNGMRAFTKTEWEAWKKEEAKRSENRGRHGRPPSPHRRSTGIEREGSSYREQPQNAVRPSRPARDFQKVSVSSDNYSEIPTDREAHKTSRVLDKRAHGTAENRRNERHRPERSRQDRQKNRLPADDFYAEHLDRMRAEKLEEDRIEREDLERRKKEGREKKKKWDERERRGTEEEDRIYEQDTEDPTEREWMAKIQAEKRRIAKEVKKEERAQEPKPRKATRKEVGREEVEHRKQRANDKNAENTETTYIYSNRDGKGENGRNHRDRIRSGDQNYNEDRDDRMNRARSTERKHTDRGPTRNPGHGMYRR